MPVDVQEERTQSKPYLSTHTMTILSFKQLCWVGFGCYFSQSLAYSLSGLGWVGGTVRMSTRVVSFAQIESICLLSGLGIALSFATAAKHQNLNQKLTNFMEQDLNLI